ncbi:LolA family protein [Streptomyces scopuliridis]|uniref:Membrane protein n=1 Tax=Streptomyces scopuliridis RB72 TaxID=1440053 RepID=A0A2T7T845_9ACTN|nr:outer membrane lipoprotein carrier protein LolA [Streptomyces scopuliridis]PVE11330.1 membrane protein [Streptomyces scopuliridis RB72]
MAPNDSARITAEDREPGEGRRKAARYALPVAVAGVAAATIGLVPALAATGDPKLPEISAQQLIEKIAASETEQLSGSVKITTDLGLPSLAGLGDLAGGALAGGKGGPSGSSDGSTADPNAKLMELSSGTHTLRVAVDGPDKQRLSIRDTAAEYSLIHNGGEVWAYDSASNEAYHATAPKDAAERGAAKGGEKNAPKDALKDVPATPKEFAEEALKAAGDTTSVSVDGTAKVAGRDAYQLLIKPKQSGSTVGSIKVAVDAKTGTPLKFTLSPSSGGKAVVDVGFTEVDFAKPAASTFDFTPPKGAKVTEEGDKSGDKTGARELPKGADGAEGPKEQGDVKVIGEGWNAVYELKTGAGEGIAGAAGADAAKSGDVPAEAQQFLDALGDKVTGKFGSGTVFKTRLVNALMTDDGTVYVGAVTQDALVKAANEAK